MSRTKNSDGRAAAAIENFTLLVWTLLLVAGSSGWRARAGLAVREPYTQGMLSATQPKKWDATAKVGKNGDENEWEWPEEPERVSKGHRKLEEAPRGFHTLVPWC